MNLKMEKMKICYFSLIFGIFVTSTIVISLFVTVLILGQELVGEGKSKKSRDLGREYTYKVSHFKNGKKSFRGYGVTSFPLQPTLKHLNPHEYRVFPLNLPQIPESRKHELIQVDESKWFKDLGLKHVYTVMTDMYCCPEEFDYSERAEDVEECYPLLVDMEVVVDGDSESHATERFENIIREFNQLYKYQFKYGCQTLEEVIIEMITSISIRQNEVFECYGFCKPRDIREFLDDYPIIYDDYGDYLSNNPEFMNKTKKRAPSPRDTENWLSEVFEKECNKLVLAGTYDPDDNDMLTDVNDDFVDKVLNRWCFSTNLPSKTNPRDTYIGTCVPNLERMDCRRLLGVVEEGVPADPSLKPRGFHFPIE